VWQENTLGPGRLAVIPGHCLPVSSADHIKAAPHRVMKQSAARTSVVFHLRGRREAELTPTLTIVQAEEQFMQNRRCCNCKDSEGLAVPYGE